MIEGGTVAEPTIPEPVMPDIDPIGPGGTGTNVPVPEPTVPEVDGETVSSVMESFTDAINGVFEFCEVVLGFMAENPILLFLLAASMVPVGFMAVKLLKELAKK